MLRSKFSDIIEFKNPEGGLAVWAKFDLTIELVQMAKNAAKNVLYIGNGTYYRNESFSCNGQRMGFASLRGNEMTEALAILRKRMLRLGCDNQEKSIRIGR